MQGSSGSCYSVLGVEENCSFKEMKRKYQSLMRLLHPDKNPNNSSSEDIKQKFHLVQSAWQILSNEITRKMYDNQLKRQHLEDEVLINEELCLADLESLSSANEDCITEYVHPCRCGGEYVLDSEYTKMHFTSIILTCENCSLNLKILLKSCECES